MLQQPGWLSLMRRLEGLAPSRWMVWLLAMAVLLAASVAGSPSGSKPSDSIRGAEAGTAIGIGVRAWLAAVNDPVYDQFLREFEPLRDETEQRRYLTAQVLAAAAAHHLDPDLLFALIAVESGFDSDAASPKGARGLGQLKFSTARAGAPMAVRRPNDLYDIPRNLYATAQHLRELLDEANGDLRTALRAYQSGPSYRHRKANGRDTYVTRVSARYAYLKVRRLHGHLAATAAGPPDVAGK